MVQLTLPRNSRIKTGKTWNRPQGKEKWKEFRAYRWNPVACHSRAMEPCASFDAVKAWRGMVRLGKARLGMAWQARRLRSDPEPFLLQPSRCSMMPSK
jgi:hypothetical protein